MDPDGRWTSTRAVLLAAAGQNRWPPAGSYMAATGQDLMAADRCQRPVGSAQWRTVELPSRGQQNCPVEARCSARDGTRMRRPAGSDPGAAPIGRR